MKSFFISFWSGLALVAVFMIAFPVLFLYAVVHVLDVGLAASVDALDEVVTHLQP